MPFCCISWKSSIVVSCCPSLTSLESRLFHENMSHSTVPSGDAASHSPTHEGFCPSPSQIAPCAFLCLKSGYVRFTLSGLHNPPTEMGRKRIPAKVSLFGLMLSFQPFHPKKLLSLCGYKPLYIPIVAS
jgi:hypothetical protein